MFNKHVFDEFRQNALNKLKKDEQIHHFNKASLELFNAFGNLDFWLHIGGNPRSEIITTLCKIFREYGILKDMYNKMPSLSEFHPQVIKLINELIGGGCNK